MIFSSLFAGLSPIEFFLLLCFVFGILILAASFPHDDDENS